MCATMCATMGATISDGCLCLMKTQGHTAPRRRASQFGTMGLEANNRIAGTEEDKEDTKHVAELLELTGATKINAAVRLKVATMKVKEASKIAGIISAAKKESALQEKAEQEESHKESVGGLATALAAGKFKKKLKVRYLFPPHGPQVIIQGG